MGLAAISRPPPGLGHNQARGRGMYAISFDLDTETLSKLYHGANWNNAYADIRRKLTASGFDWQQGSVYFGNDTVDAVKCVLVVQDLAKTYPWFEPSMRDLRMLRIEDNNDLLPAIR